MVVLAVAEARPGAARVQAIVAVPATIALAVTVLVVLVPPSRVPTGQVSTAVAQVQAMPLAETYRT